MSIRTYKEVAVADLHILEESTIAALSECSSSFKINQAEYLDILFSTEGRRVHNILLNETYPLQSGLAMWWQKQSDSMPMGQTAWLNALSYSSILSFKKEVQMLTQSAGMQEDSTQSSVTNTSAQMKIPSSLAFNQFSYSVSSTPLYSSVHHFQ